MSSTVIDLQRCCPSIFGRSGTVLFCSFRVNEAMVIICMLSKGKKKKNNVLLARLVVPRGGWFIWLWEFRWTKRLKLFCTGWMIKGKCKAYQRVSARGWRYLGIQRWNVTPFGGDILPVPYCSTWHLHQQNKPERPASSNKFIFTDFPILSWATDQEKEGKRERISINQEN